MSAIEVDLNTVPDEIPALPSGTYTFVVESASIEPSKKGDSNNLILKMKVSQDGNPSHGRAMTDYINLGANEFAPVACRRLIRAAGLPLRRGGSLSELMSTYTSDLIGKHVQARVKCAPSTDPETGRTRERSNIAEYLVA